MSNHDDDYLWDKSGPPDPDVEKLERSLSRFRYEPRAFDAKKVAPARPPRRVFAHAPLRARLALAASIALVAGAAIFASRPPADDALQCNVVGLEGTTRAGGSVVSPETPKRALALGEEVVTAPDSRARIELASGIGHVDVAPGTRVRVEEIHDQEQRLRLAEGSISAQVVAIPRLFMVDTPAVRAVDLGCAYTLTADEAGNGSLAVTSGRVELGALEGSTRARSIVPAGASCEIRAESGAGTPFWNDAPEAMRAALTRADFEGGGAAAFDDVIREARAADALTLVHLLERAPGSVMPALYTKLAAIAPPPAGITRQAVFSRQRFAIEAWREAVLDGGVEPSWKGFDPKPRLLPKER